MSNEDYFKTFDQRIEFLRIHEKLDELVIAVTKIKKRIDDMERAARFRTRVGPL
jgi:hypothetical protein